MYKRRLQVDFLVFTGKWTEIVNVSLADFYFGTVLSSVLAWWQAIS